MSSKAIRTLTMSATDIVSAARSGAVGLGAESKRTMALREPTVFILTALAGGKIHGYGIIQAVKELSDGRITLRTGTLYGALDRLERDGHIAFAGEASEAGPPRRYYELTPAGSKLLQAEVAQMQTTATLLSRQLKQTLS